ncbi:MAG: undecaprenyl-diphosphate phosphatase [Pirellulales bacterium]|nr:undecaprenyl-diphosphate phosphatase [Pirellulales bacterium]
MQYLHIIVLAVVQGVTEFLPVSSSGHLVLANELLEALSLPTMPDMLELNIVLHAGTLLAVLVVYWRQVCRVLGEDRRAIISLLIGSLPALAVGLPLHEIAALRNALGNPLLAASLLPVTGLLLLWGARRASGHVELAALRPWQALVVGLFQAAAILPGISRSGATIAAGLAVGLRRDTAATFSFLLAIPAICGAVLLEARQMVLGSTSTLSAGPLLAGMAASCLVGVISLRWLLRWLQGGRLHYFAWWCIPVGVAATLWLLLVPAV